MNCNECLALLHEYFTERLAPDQRAAVEEHERQCASCHALMETAREITCKEVSDFLNEYVDGELAPERRAVFERHLALCGECVDYMTSYRATVKLAKRALTCDELGSSAKLPERLVQAILEARRQTPPTS